MPLYRVDFEVKADVCLEDGCANLKLTASAHTVTFTNGKRNKNGDCTGLLASVIGPDESLTGAAHTFRGILAEKLDLMTFVTQTRFEIKGPKMAIEWDLGKPEREFTAFAIADPRWPPQPLLNASYVESAQRFIDANLPEYVEVALRAFRVGARAQSAEDQFPSFWTAFEGLVEASKDKAKVPVLCQKCKAPLTCEVASCHAVQLRTPMAVRAMAERAEKMLGKQRAEKVFPALVHVRHKLTHGGSLAEIERVLAEKHQCTLQQCVDMIARLAHGAILETARVSFGDSTPIKIGFVSSFVLGELTARGQGSVSAPGPGMHPDPTSFNLEMVPTHNPAGTVEL